jgi:serine/threonine-protein kinase
MKVLLRSVFAEDPDAGARFVCEARAAARGTHPGIVNVSDFGSLADGRAYLVMELLSGESVADVLRAEGALESLRALRLIRDAAEALAAAHEVGVVHRDLTPSNMFVETDQTGEERLVLVDFGAAKMTQAGGDDEEERASVVFGTPYYMAPEHAQGRSTDGRADIYSLGCCLFEMLTGEVPYTAETVRKILLRHILDPLPTLTGPADKPFLRALIRRMLAKRPKDRYQSADALAADVRMCIDELESER